MAFDDWKGIAIWFLIVTAFSIVAGIIGVLFFKISILKAFLGYIFTILAVIVIMLWMAYNDRRS